VRVVEITLQLTGDEAGALRRRASAEGLSLPDAVHLAVRQYLGQGYHGQRVAAGADRVMAAHADALERLAQ
jgi:hypothetical protein